MLGFKRNKCTRVEMETNIFKEKCYNYCPTFFFKKTYVCFFIVENSDEELGSKFHLCFFLIRDFCVHIDLWSHITVYL